MAATAALVAGLATFLAYGHRDPNLLVGHLFRPSFVRNAERLTDGVAARAGDHWLTDLTVTLDAGDGVEWDLGRARPLRAAYLVGDHNDAYLLLASDDGATWRPIWEAEPVESQGQRPRSTDRIRERARYLRLEAGDGDSVRTVSELAVYDQVPAEWPPVFEEREGTPVEPGERIEPTQPPPPTAMAVAVGLAALALLIPWSRRRVCSPPAWLPKVTGQAWSWFLGAAALLVVWTALAYSADYRFGTIDDAYISFQYAKHLISGQGLTFNPGERVEGYTNCLWIVLLAPLWPLVGKDPVLFTRAAVALAALLAVVDLALVGAISHRLLGRKVFATAFAILLVAFDDAYIAYATFAMESHLVIACMLLGLWLYVARPKAWPWWLGLSFALCGMARPDGLLWPITFALVHADVLWSRSARQSSGLDVTAAAQTAIAFLVPAAVYFVARYTYYGYLLPNTFYLKVGDTFAGVERGLEYLKTYAVERLGVPALALVSVVLLRRRWVRWLLLFLVVHSAYVVFVGGDFYSGHRFLMPVTPVSALLIAALAGAWLNHTRRRRPPLWLAASAVAICLAVRWGTLEAGPRPAEIAVWGTIVDNDVRYMQWLGSVKRDGASMVIGDIGAAGFFADVVVRDVYGIVDPQIAHMGVADLGTGKAGHEKRGTPEYLMRTNPTYVKFNYVPHGYVWRDYFLVTDFPPHLRVPGLWVRKPAWPAPTVGEAFTMEGSTLSDWSREGAAFARSPTLGTPPGQGQVIGATGRYLNSLDAEGGDQAVGAIRSPPFTLEGAVMRLAVGGGCVRELLRVSLVVAGRRVRSATGTCFETLGRREWDIAPWRGQTAQLEVVDQAQGPWGHILVDEVVQLRDPTKPGDTL